MDNRPAWEPWYRRVINGEGLKTVQHDVEHDPMPSGRRIREYEDDPVYDPELLGAAVQYLEGDDVLVRRGMVEGEVLVYER